MSAYPCEVRLFEPGKEEEAYEVTLLLEGFQVKPILEDVSSIYSTVTHFVPVEQRFILTQLDPPSTAEAALYLSRVWALRGALGRATYRFLGMPVSFAERNTRSGPRATWMLTDVAPQYAFSSARRWSSGFWPWERNWMEGEPNKFWEALGKLEEAVSGLTSKVDALLAREKARTAKRDLHLFTHVQEAGEEADHLVRVEAGMEGRFYVWDADLDAWVRIQLSSYYGGDESDDLDGDPDDY